MIYGYARVSTKGQATDGNSLEMQIQVLKENGAEEIFSDAFTGTKINRPEFDKMNMKIKSGDTILVCKLDRIARSATQGYEMIKSWIDKDITVNILNMGIANSSPTGKLMLQILFAFAEFERDMIVLRCQEGKMIAKKNPDFKEGRPKKYSDEKIRNALELLDMGKSYSQVSNLTCISKSTLVRAKKNRS